MKQLQKNSKKYVIPFKWNGEIKITDAFTILLVVIGFVSLTYQRKDLTTKVDSIQSVVDSLQKEKQERMDLGLNMEIKRINSFTYDLKYTLNELNKIEVVQDEESAQKLNELSLLIDIQLKNKGNSVIHDKALQLLKDRNNAQLDLYNYHLLYDKKIKDFDKQFEPKREKFKSDNEFIIAQDWFTDTLQKNMNYLLNQMALSMKNSKQRINEIDIQLMALRN